MLQSLLDALLDTLKLMPWLLIMHVLIEIFEYHAVSKIKLNKALRGKFAPLIGSACALLPQCGFGVVAADLYSRKSVRLGTTVAVFIATSDEAIPVLLSSPGKDSIIKLGLLLGFKFIAAIIAGYALNFILRKSELTAIDSDVVVKGCHHHELGEHTHEDHDHNHEIHDHANDREQVEHSGEESEMHDHANDHESIDHAGENAEQPHTTDKPNNEQKRITDKPKQKKFDFKCFVVHPLLHTLTVSGYILAVNVVFAVILYFVGEARLVEFLSGAKYFQPFLAGLIGLIPNCASSVIIAQTFSGGSITLGAAFAGLSVNAGLGLAVLLKKNKPVKNTFLIAGGLYLYSCIIGVLLSLLPF